MDALREAINNVSLYEVKAAVRKAQNVVMNYTEMEAKVREATNNEPWGASSTLMNEIASATYNYQLLNEIMPMIYKRFTDKAAEEWRQIYKALQLLEFLIRNGAEQVIDDARSHLSTIKMLRQFYFIDNAGKDQGVNVRNRAKELADLLSDVDRIRAERKKARNTKNKYIGVEGGGSGGFSMSNSMGGGMSNRNSGRFGGFGNESADFGGYGGSSSGGVYGDGGGFGGQSRSGGFHDDGIDTRRFSGGGGGGGSQRFEEYDEYDDGGARRPTAAAAPAAPPPPPRAASQQKKKAPEPEIDLLAGDNDFVTSAPAPSKPADDFDDFDDFQSATPAPAPAPATTPSYSIPAFNPVPRPPLTSSASGLSLVQPKPVSSTDQSGMRSVVGFSTPPPPSTSSSSFPPPASNPQRPMGYQPAQPNYFTSIPLSSTSTSTPSPKPQLQQKKAGTDAFGSIWNQASSGVRKTTPVPTVGKTSLQAMAKEKASAGIWGTGEQKRVGGGSGGSGGGGYGGLGDLLG